MLRQSGCIYLPSQRTLRDYTYFHSTTIGFSAQVDQQLLDVAKLENELNQYVILVLDEMYINEELVYDKHEGELIASGTVISSISLVHSDLEIWKFP